MSAQFDRGSGFEPEPGEDLPPLENWPPPEIVARWEARKEAARRRRSFRRRVIAWAVVVAVIVGGIVFIVKRNSGNSGKPKAAAPAARPATVVWAVNTATASFVAVVSNSGGLGPVAIAIPCHRVVRSDGGLAGYRWGVERKRELLEREAAR